MNSFFSGFNYLGKNVNAHHEHTIQHDDLPRHTIQQWKGKLSAQAQTPQSLVYNPPFRSRHLESKIIGNLRGKHNSSNQI